MDPMLRLAGSYGVLCFAIIALAAIIGRVLQARRWIEVKGRLLGFETEERSSSVTKSKSPFILKASYRYEWNGQHYDGVNCYVLGVKPLGGESTRRFIDSYQKSQTERGFVPVFIDQRKPQRSVLDRRLPGGTFVVYLSLIIACTTLITWENAGGRFSQEANIRVATTAFFVALALVLAVFGMRRL